MIRSCWCCGPVTPFLHRVLLCKSRPTRASRALLPHSHLRVSHFSFSIYVFDSCIIGSCVWCEAGIWVALSCTGLSPPCWWLCEQVPLCSCPFTFAPMYFVFPVVPVVRLSSLIAHPAHSCGLYVLIRGPGSPQSTLLPPYNWLAGRRPLLFHISFRIRGPWFSCLVFVFKVCSLYDCNCTGSVGQFGNIDIFMKFSLYFHEHANSPFFRTFLMPFNEVWKFAPLKALCMFY